MERGKIFILILSLIVAIEIVGASFEYKGNNINKQYGVGESIFGKVNLTFDKEPARNLFTSKFLGNISLIELLKANKFIDGKNYTCSTKNCSKQFTIEGPISEVDVNGEKVIGLKIEGNDVESIEKLKFKIESPLINLCEPPVLLDVLDDGRDIISSSSYNDVPCSVRYGCFNRALTSGYNNAKIYGEICEEIKIGPAPAYRIGAKLKKTGEKNSEIEMSLKDNSGEVYNCMLPNVTELGENLDCIVQFSSALETNFSVCINNLGDPDNPEVSVKFELQEPICGQSGRDFEIFARQLQYNKSVIELNKDVYEKLFGSSLYESVYKYLYNISEKNKEKGIECNPCIVPIKIIGPEQKIQISDVDIEFIDNGIVVISDEKQRMFNLSIDEGRITSNLLSIELKPANFVVPFGAQEKFELFLGDKLVFAQDISIKESFDFNVTPLFVLVGIETKFEAETEYNISYSKWDFGDGASKESFGKEALHRYKEGGNFKLKVELKKNDGTVAYKVFDIVVGNAQKAANLTLERYRNRLINVSNQIKSYPALIQEKIKNLTELDKIQKSLDSLEKKFDNANKDEEYAEIVNSLLALDVPYSIAPSKKGILPMSIGFDNIQTDYIAEVSDEEAEGSEKLKEGIMKWYDSHFNADVQFEIISVFSDKGKEDVITKYSILVDPAPDNEDSAFLFIDFPFNEINFQGGYEQKPISEGKGAYIALDGSKKETIDFFVQGSLEVSDLGAFISPEISKLSIEELKPTCEPGDEECEIPFPWGQFFLWMGLLAGIILVLYIILQEWYKKHYEKYLFPNSNDLYNLINFIYNSRVAGLEDEEIRRKLKDSKWSSERINYAFKKIDGKRTGMWEIPIFKSAENRRVREELEKRHGLPPDARFIKRPRF